MQPLTNGPALIQAYGRTIRNIAGTGRDGLVSVAVGRGDAGYTLTVGIVGDAASSVTQHFLNLDQARLAFGHVVRNLAAE